MYNNKYYIVSTSEGRDNPEKSFSDIKKTNPHAVVLVKGTEVNVEDAFSAFLNLLEPWLVRNDKFLHVFSSGIQVNKPITDRANVKWYVCPLIDVVNYDSIIDYYEQGKPILSSPSKLFTCYNNHPRNYRSYLIDHLAKHDLLNSGVVTYRLYLEILGKRGNFDPLEDFSYYKGVPRLADEEDFLMYENNYEPNGIPKSYLTGLVDVVTESTVTNGESWVTEKTSKPLMTQKPFMALAPMGYQKWLNKEYGIEPYDELFNYDFDSLPRFEDRADGIISNLLRIKNIYKTPDDYSKLLEILKPKLQHNLSQYLTKVASGERFLKDMPFDWINQDYDFLVKNVLARKEEDYQCEFSILHDFLHRVVEPYNKKEYNIIDISK